MTNRAWQSGIVAFLTGFAAIPIAALAATNTFVSGDATQGGSDNRAAAAMVAVAVHAKPRLTCKLYTAGHPEKAGIELATDDDGYARFYALKVQATSPYRKQLLACRAERGATSTFAIDLAAAKTFIPHPIDLRQERGRDRPALQGDPMSPSRQELIARGYGLRPDPAQQPAGYASWLLAASEPARMLEIERKLSPKAALFVEQGDGWAGTVLEGAPRYVAVQSYMNVPTAIPGGDGTTGTQTALWNGLGGFGTGSGLIQSGFFLTTSTVAAGYATFREYCCGDPNGVSFPGAFTPNPGDVLLVQNWYCDGDGTPNVDGAFGCSYVHDLTSGALLNCTTQSTACPAAEGLTPCSTDNAVPNCMTPGGMAEFIAEQTSDQQGFPVSFTPIAPTVAMSGFATSTTGNQGHLSEYVNTDPAVVLLTDWTNASTRLDVRIHGNDTTCFTTYARQPEPQSPPRVECSAAPLPQNSSPIQKARLEELVAVVLFGIIQDAGGVAVVDGSFVRIPPRGPVSESLASLPTDLSERLGPLLKELPNTAIGINALAVQLERVVADYRDANLAHTKQLR